VLVHGSATDARTWDPLRAELPDGFDVLAIDRRGHGMSDPGSSAAETFEPEGEDVAAVLRLAGPDALVLAHSYGARCAIEAFRHGAVAAGAVLFEPLMSPLRTGHIAPDIIEPVRALERAGDADGALRLFHDLATDTPPTLVDRLALEEPWQIGLESVGTLARELHATITDTLSAPDLAHVALPIRLLTGSRTLEKFRAHARLFADALPNATLVELEGEGHLAHELAPRAIVAQLLELAGAAR
jgi:pimeloyl-ACP methyl ester carboxylesterase